MSQQQDTKELILELLRSQNFKIEARVLSNLAIILVGIIKSASLSLPQIALNVDNQTHQNSKYKKIQRFVHKFKPNFQFYIVFVWKQFVLDKDKVVLSMDRTNWKLGAVDINFLVLSLCYQGVAIPLVWKLLPHKGNSNTQAQKALFKLLFKRLTSTQVKQIQALTADREFGSKDLIEYLMKAKIAPIIRLRKDTAIWHKGVPAWKLFECDQAKHLRKPVVIMGIKGYLSGRRLMTKKGLDYLIVFNPVRSYKTLNLYSLRWEIECLFAALKSRGFNLESTHITHPKRLSSLFFLASLSLCWLLIVGHKRLVKQFKIAVKTYKEGERLAVSVFRFALDFVRSLMFHNKSLKPYLKLVSCT